MGKRGKKMTIKELIEKLKLYPDNLPVVASGYENGYNPIVNVKEITLYKRCCHSWYEGMYDDDPEQKADPKIDALYFVTGKTELPKQA